MWNMYIIYLYLDNYICLYTFIVYFLYYAFDYSILFCRWDDIFSWFWNACFFLKYLVMYSFYACNLPNDSWNILGIDLSNWLSTDLGSRKKLQMLGISLKRHEHRNQASTLKGGEQLKDSLVRTSCYVQSVVRYHISSVVCILHNLHTVNIRQYRCTVCIYIYM